MRKWEETFYTASVQSRTILIIFTRPKWDICILCLSARALDRGSIRRNPQITLQKTRNPRELKYLKVKRAR